MKFGKRTFAAAFASVAALIGYSIGSVNKASPQEDSVKEYGLSCSVSEDGNTATISSINYRNPILTAENKDPNSGDQVSVTQRLIDPYRCIGTDCITEVIKQSDDITDSGLEEALKLRSYPEALTIQWNKGNSDEDIAAGCKVIDGQLDNIGSKTLNIRRQSPYKGWPEVII